jgi:putative oligomerization/nucleic acid binding protein
VIWIFTLGLGGPVYLQYNLNQVWANERKVPPPLPGGSPTADADLVRLKKLTDLRESGAISADEFEAEKARILPSAQSRSEPSQEP